MNKMFLTDTVYKVHLTATLFLNKMHLTGTIPVNKLQLTGTGYLAEEYINAWYHLS